jgi:hypothetical protein
MKLKELIEEARERTGDLTEDYKCSDVRFTRFANQAQREACRRSRLLVDSTTESICEIELAANTGVYDLDSRVLFVRRAIVAGQTRPLARMHHKDMDARGTEWMTETGAEVLAWVVGLDTRKLRLYPIPTAAAVVTLTVCRLPLDDLEAKDDEPEIEERLHDSLVDWMVYRYYDTADTEMRNPGKAAEALAAFEREFGPPATAIEEQWAAEHYGFQPDDGNVYGA